MSGEVPAFKHGFLHVSVSGFHFSSSVRMLLTYAWLVLIKKS